MSNSIYSGYSATVWEAIYAGLAYFNTQLAAATTASGSSLSTLASQAEGMYFSLRNGVAAIDAYQLSQAWTFELQNMQAIQGLPLVLDAETVSLFNGRTIAYQNALTGVNALIPVEPFNPPSIIDNAGVIIPAVGLLSWLGSFAGEPVPVLAEELTTEDGLIITTEDGEPIVTLSAATSIPEEAYGVATAMLTVANAIKVFQGQEINQLYDTAYLQYQCAQSAANLIASFTSGPIAQDYQTVNTWNQIVTVPAITMCADTLNGAGYSEQLQQMAVLRYAMLTTADKIAVLLLSLRQPLTSRINITTLRVDETLIDVAARALGNFELWPQIATLNGLKPPYVGAVASPGVAAFGTQLILPTPGTQISAIGTLPNYNTNFLGNDLYIGPINGSMPPWAGDFQIIGGYKNLAWALGRRIQTNLGSLMYHPAYGCRIPPEVGAVQSNVTIGHINAFGKSALQSDPRVASVISTTSSLGVNGAVQFVAQVQPGGFQTSTVGINEVIAPAA